MASYFLKVQIWNWISDQRTISSQTKVIARSRTDGNTLAHETLEFPEVQNYIISFLWVGWCLGRW